MRTISGRKVPAEFMKPNKLIKKNYESMKLTLPNEQQLISKM